MRDWKQRITPENLPEPYQKFAEVLGTEKALALCETFGGEVIYIPKPDAAYNAVRVAEIVRRYYGGDDIQSLCRRFGIRRRTLYDILNKSRNEERER